MTSATTTHLVQPQVACITASTPLSKEVGRQKRGELQPCFQALAACRQLGTPTVQQPCGQPEKPLPWAEGNLALQDKSFSSLKAGGKCEWQAQDLAERLSNPNQSCWLRSYGLLKSTVNLMHLQRPGNVDRCCYQSAVPDLSHP